MEELFDKWDITFSDFEEKYPQLVEMMKRWVPYSSYEIIVETNDGSVYIYDHELNEVRGYCENLEYFEHDISEEESRKKLGYRLRSRLKKMGMTYDDLSDVTGISRVTISNYATGKATPSMYNLSKIARALKCTTQTLSGN